ncbi:ATP-binding cassette subfamily C protein CydD [Luteibacter sp. Sphag1AF]|uniref:thiol reductant ABC exporter subunit CydD n=1 Tax=Luteibacter sp. Sphag1AF TaxID=2587031 RepID=UPI0016202656|nr:thiol reductant ABC exporter subunit CydD [Luteibacter sp. Sphag1AF]MBB3228257.1 ATP-binding cassette subfamily C protein CydD [Luteibacter sp. Sphag1AF]
MSTNAPSWLRARARPLRSLLTRGIAAGTAHALLVCAGAWLIAHVLAQAIFADRALATLWPELVALVVTGALRAWLVVVQRAVQFDAGARIVEQVHHELDASLKARGPKWAAQQASGDVVTRLVDGVDALAPYYSGYLPQMYLSLIIPAVVLVCILTAEPWSALVLLGCTPLLPVFMILAGKAAAAASERRWMRLRRLGARFMDALSGLTTLRLYGAAEREQQVLAATGDAYRRDTMGVLRIAFLSALVLEFFATVSIAVIAVLIGFRLLGGKLAFEPGMFVLLLAPEFFAPLRALGTQRHQRMEAVAAAEGVLEVLGGSGDDNLIQPHTGTHVPGRQAPAILFDEVTFAHDAGRDVLDHVSLHIPAGSRLTLVGESGSGKSTLLNLLMGFVSPQRGRVLIDGIDMADLDMSAWRDRISWVSQRPYVFHGSVRDNLMIARPDADELSLRRAIQFASLETVIAGLPDGMATLLGEHGTGLSGGQFQRLALARAWLRNAPVLLLDEPTQHLDAATARSIDEALETFATGRTVIRVAHRLDAIADDEMVAVMSHGRIVEYGVAAHLRTQAGFFSSLVAADRSA